MVETLTPAGCGGRARRRIAVTCFTIGAIAAAAALGAALGLIGGALPALWAVAAALLVGLLGAARELGLRGIPIPESRRQVPEPWRREKPLVVWSTVYGAILGSGVGTFQPVATFWVACAGALALGRPVAAAACLAMFGLGRAVMVVFPGGDPLRRLAGAHRAMRSANAIVLVAFLVLLAPSAAAGAPPSGQSDPSVSRGVIAYADQRAGASNVVVRQAGRAPVIFPDARLPALSGDALAYVDDAGIRLVLWRTGQEILRVPGPVDRPALSGPRLAYVESVGAGRRLVVRNFSTGVVRVIRRVGPGVDLGRPALSGLLLAWHEAGGASNRLLLRSLGTGRTQVVADGRRSGLHVNPAIAAGHIAWVESRAERSSLLIRRILNGRIRHLAAVMGPRFHLWHTALEPGRAYVTRWSLNTGRAAILRYRWTP